MTGFIGLAYEGICSYLHNRRQKALHKAVVVIENKVNLQHNKIIHLEDMMVIYSIYNSETLEKLINTVHKMHITTTPNERLFTGMLSSWYTWYLSKDGVNHYAINSLIFENAKREICINV